MHVYAVVQKTERRRTGGGIGVDGGSRKEKKTGATRMEMGRGEEAIILVLSVALPPGESRQRTVCTRAMRCRGSGGAAETAAARARFLCHHHTHAHKKEVERQELLWMMSGERGQGAKRGRQRPEKRTDTRARATRKTNQHKLGEREQERGRGRDMWKRNTRARAKEKGFSLWQRRKGDGPGPTEGMGGRHEKGLGNRRADLQRRERAPGGGRKGTRHGRRARAARSNAAASSLADEGSAVGETERTRTNRQEAEKGRSLSMSSLAHTLGRR